MSDTRSTPVAGPTDGEALPGEAVRTLFDRNEQVLEALRLELEAAVAEADDAEARVRTHPALGLLAADEVQMLVPPERPRDDPATLPAGPPLTTVDRRPSVARPAPGQVAGPVDGGDVDVDGRTRIGRLVTGHWVWKAGVAVVVVALLLLKFG